MDVFRHLRDAVRRKRPEFKEFGIWKLHHNYARPCCAAVFGHT